MADKADPPFVDAHARTIAAPRERVWSELERFVATTLVGIDRPLVARLLGTEPSSGFELADTRPGERLVLRGRHRFSRYLLEFDVSDTDDGGSLLRASTYAEFPGVLGGIYRLLVIGSRGHVVATTGMLRRIERRSIERRSS